MGPCRIWARSEWQAKNVEGRQYGLKATGSALAVGVDGTYSKISFQVAE